MNLEFIEDGHVYKLDGKIIPSVNQLLPKPDFQVSEDVLEKARQKGIENHSLIKMYHDTGQTYGEGLLERFHEWMEKQPYGSLLAYEKPMYAHIDGMYFAGTPDMIFEGAIVDFKSNYSNTNHYALQMAGYNILVHYNFVSIERVERILIRDTGKKIAEKNVSFPEAIPVFVDLLKKYYIDQRVDEYYNTKLNRRNGSVDSVC